MTDRSHELSPEERVRRLQERRARTAGASPAGRPTGGARPRRRHPAAKSRMFLAGLAVASFGVVGASMAIAPSASTSTVAAPAAPVAPVAAPAVSTASATPAPKAATPAPSVTRSAPVTQTRGS